MNLLYDLDQAVTILSRCEGSPETRKARMNFIVNLVTILELFSRSVLRNTEGADFDEDSYPLSIILQVVSSKDEKCILSKMVQIRNEIIHEGKTASLTEESINVFYSLVKKTISTSQ